MYLEEKIAELEARIKKLEEQKPSTNDDMIIVKFQRDRDLEATVPMKRVPIQIRRERPVEPKVTYGTEKQEEQEPEEEDTIEQEREEVEEMLDNVKPQSKNANEWVTVQDKPGEEIYRYNGHTLAIFEENGKRFAQVDNKPPTTLSDKEKKAFKEVERIKLQMEKRLTIR